MRSELPNSPRMVVGRAFLVLTNAFQFGRSVGGFTTNVIHSRRRWLGVPRCRRGKYSKLNWRYGAAAAAPEGAKGPRDWGFLLVWGRGLCTRQKKRWLGGSVTAALRRRRRHRPPAPLEWPRQSTTVLQTEEQKQRWVRSSVACHSGGAPAILVPTIVPTPVPWSVVFKTDWAVGFPPPLVLVAPAPVPAPGRNYPRHHQAPP